jgi:hypothetical protein
MEWTSQNKSGKAKASSPWRDRETYFIINQRHKAYGCHIRHADVYQLELLVVWRRRVPPLALNRHARTEANSRIFVLLLYHLRFLGEFLSTANRKVPQHNSLMLPQTLA